MVRCPACKTIFSPAAGLAPPEPEEEDERDEEEEKPRRKKRRADDEEQEEEEKPKPKNRDPYPLAEGEEERRPKTVRSEFDESLTPAERAARRRAFGRATIGCRLIWISFALFNVSMLFITIFFFQATFVPPEPLLITFAGLFGLINWILAAVGVGLCLSGPRAPGHWGYGIGAAVAVGIHLIFLMVLVAQGKEHSVGQFTEEVQGVSGNARWGMLPTRLDVTMFYLTAIVYPNEPGAAPRGKMGLSMVTGLAEMV